MKIKLLAAAVALSLATQYSLGDDTDIYVKNNTKSGAPYLMLMLDHRQDLTGPYCGGKDSCIDLLNNDKDFHLLQALDVMYNGVPGDTDSDGKMDDIALAILQGDINLDGLRDSAASMTEFDANKSQALAAVLQVVFDKFNGIQVGLAMPNRDDGGTIMRGYKLFEEGDSNDAKSEIIEILMNIPVAKTGKEYHATTPKELFMEWYQYLNGGTIISGKKISQNFPDSSLNNRSDINAISDGSTYKSPFAANPTDFECARLYNVYATSANEGGSDNDLNDYIDKLFGAGTSGKFEFLLDHAANNDFLPSVPGKQVVKTWIIRGGSANTFAGRWAEAAGTSDQLMTVSKDNSLYDVQATLEAAFIEALSVSTTFVAASVPVNVFNRIQTLDNFYIALFEAQTNERWHGNIKKFKLKDTSVPTDGVFDDIVDINGISAFNTSDGRVKYEALSFWTNPASLPAADPEKNEVDGRDGRTVNRGGVGQNMPAPASRRLYAEPASGSTFDAFDATLASDSSIQRAILHLSDSDTLDATTEQNTKDTIDWARGVDVDDKYVSDNRDWYLGDAIHSRPLALNYGATTGYSNSNPNIRLFMGTNDGFFHIFENTSTSGSESGKEVFAFIPRESLDVLKKIRENNGSNRHPYGVDGEPVALVNDKDNDGTIESGEEVYVYVGMRRGGNSYYALDVSDPSATPKLQWKITQGGDFAELGMTFSTPVVTKVKFESTARDVLIFGGGYDTAYDNGGTKAPENPSTAFTGAAIYIVDARTGKLVWKVTGHAVSNSNSALYASRMKHAIPSQVAALDSDQNGITDRLYVGDLSGLLWRIDLPEGSTSDHRQTKWTATAIADLDDDGENEDRRMFHAPDIVQSTDEKGPYDGILIATGDRANPLETTDENYAFFIKDRNINSGKPPSTFAFEDDSLTDVTSCVTGNESGCATANLYSGWKIKLGGNGEKGLASPLVAAGKVFFTSYEPSSGTSCEPAEGSGNLYAVNLKDGTAAYSTQGRPIDIGPGIPPSVTAIGNDTLIIPSAGIVKLDQPVPSNDKTKLIEAGGKPMHIIYWRETGVDDL